MAQWRVDASQPAMVEHSAELPGGTARVVVAVISGTTDFALRVFVTKPDAPEEEIAGVEAVHPDPGSAAALGRQVAEQALAEARSVDRS